VVLFLEKNHRGLDLIAPESPPGSSSAPKRRKAKSAAQIRDRVVGIMPAVHFTDWLRIYVASFRSNKNPFLKMGLKYTLQCQEERRAVVAMKIRPAHWHNFRRVDLNPCFRIFRDRRVQLVE
jgi:hypothetical protein